MALGISGVAGLTSTLSIVVAGIVTRTAAVSTAATVSKVTACTGILGLVVFAGSEIVGGVMIKNDLEKLEEIDKRIERYLNDCIEWFNSNVIDNIEKNPIKRANKYDILETQKYVIERV